jgi:uncharacterized membrane protein YjgN (DUF898 family)
MRQVPTWRLLVIAFLAVLAAANLWMAAFGIRYTSRDGNFRDVHEIRTNWAVAIATIAVVGLIALVLLRTARRR